MKTIKIQKKLSILFLLILTLASCSKDNEIPSPASDEYLIINNPRYQKTSNYPNAASNIEVLYTFTYNQFGYVTSVELTNKATGKMIEKSTFKLISAK